MKKYCILFIVLVIGLLQAKAQDISFVINAPSTVVEGGQFQLQYILKGGQTNAMPDIPEEIRGFDVLYGPSVSQMFSSRTINGKTTSESNTTYTFLLMANKSGSYTLPVASIKVGASTYKSNTVDIKVLPPDANADPSTPGQQPQAMSSKSTGKVDPNDAFIRAVFSKTKVNEQEAVMVTFRFYTVLNISSVGKIEFPEFEGFMTEDFELPINRQWAMEHFKGRNYMVMDVKKTLLFPQRSGKMPIPSGKMEIVFEVSSGKRINHPLFGPQEIMTEAKKTLTTDPVTIDVSPLPDGKPANFSGGVGSLSIKSNLSETKVKANDAITYTITISGTGNMKLIKNPEPELDKNIEVYDPKVTNDLKLSPQGLSGTKKIEYLVIPRYPGEYKIPAIEFSYYDQNSKSYKKISTEGYTIQVDKDPNAGKGGSSTSYMNQQEVKVEQDIRYIKTDEMQGANPTDFLVGKTTYWLWYIIPVLLLVGFMIVYRKQIQANADLAGMRTKKANKVAAKRLKLAKKYLETQNKDGFYEEVLRAVWGYLSDKLSIPVANLNRENIENELLRFGADESLVKQYISILDTCEFARYAPAESNKAMDNLYSETVDAIGKMENTIKIK